MSVLEWAWLGLAVVAGVIAWSKGRSGFGYFLLALVLTPIIGLIVVLAISRNDVVIEIRLTTSGDRRRCPACAELVRIQAEKCRFCGALLVPVDAIERTASYRAGKALRTWWRRGEPQRWW